MPRIRSVFFAVFFTGLALEFDTPPTKDCLGPYSAGFWPCWKVSPERSCPPGLCRQPSSGLRPDLANYPQLRLLTTNARAVHLLRASFYLGEPPGIGERSFCTEGRGVLAPLRTPGGVQTRSRKKRTLHTPGWVQTTPQPKKGENNSNFHRLIF